MNALGQSRAAVAAGHRTQSTAYCGLGTQADFHSQELELIIQYKCVACG